MQTFLDWFSTRRILIIVVLTALTYGVLTAKESWTHTDAPAQAGTCWTEDARYDLWGGDVPATVARVHFGGTICKNDDGTIASVRPILDGGIQGAGGIGWVFVNGGTWTEEQHGTYARVLGRSTLKLCFGAGNAQVCSPTDTQTYELRVQTTWGPYLPGTEPGIWPSSQTCYLDGGCAPGITFHRID